MGHPDQHTPDDHRTSNREHAPRPDLRQELAEDLDEEELAELQERARTGSTVRAEEPDGKRLGEAGHTYVGRQMDDDLQANPRIEDQDDVVE